MYRLLVFACLIIMACCRMTTPHFPEGVIDSQAMEECRRAFVYKAFQVSHRINITMPDSSRHNIIGVVVVYPMKGVLNAALLSAEGVVLFEGHSKNGESAITKAVEILDDRTFADKLFSDLRLLFIPPISHEIYAECGKSGKCVCVWRDDAGLVEEVKVLDSRVYEISLYDGTTRQSHVCYGPPATSAAKAASTLLVSDIGGYLLELELLEFALLDRPSEISP